MGLEVSVRRGVGAPWGSLGSLGKLRGPLGDGGSMKEELRFFKDGKGIPGGDEAYMGAGEFLET